MRLLLSLSSSGSPAETYRSHGFGGCTACGAGYAGDRHTDMCMAASQGSQGHVLCSLWRYGTILFQHGLSDTEHFLLGDIAVGDEAAVVPLRTACDCGDRLTQPATGAGFSSDQQPLALIKLQPYFGC